MTTIQRGTPWFVELFLHCYYWPAKLAGAAVYPDRGLDAHTLTKAADEAMYLAKVVGRNSIRLCETKK
jgi:hypothetical protein